MTITMKSLSAKHATTVLAAARVLYGAAMPADVTAVLAKHSVKNQNASWYGVRILRADCSTFTETGAEDTYHGGIDCNDHTEKAAVRTFVETMECNIAANARATAL